MNDYEELYSWTARRLGRYYWLAHMMREISKVKRQDSRKAEVYDFLVNHLASLENIKRRLEGGACIPDCTAYCCYFSKGYEKQLPITRREKARLKEILKADKSKIEQFCTMVPIASLHEKLVINARNRPEFIFYVNGAEMACTINPTNRRIQESSLQDMPKTLVKRDKMWVRSDSCACRFLENKKCNIYSSLRFMVCSEFLCLTALAIAVLAYLGFADEKTMKMPMKNLNQLASEVAIAFRSNGLLELEAEYDDIVKSIAIVYAKGEYTDKEFKKAKKLELEYGKKLSKSIKEVIQTV